MSLLIECADPNEPAFLRRLRGGYGGDSARHVRPLARPRNQKNGEDEDEAPTFVQEDGHDTMSKAEYDELVKDAEVEEQERKSAAPPAKSKNETDRLVEEPDKLAQDLAPLKRQVARIGGSTKRRLVNVVGDDDEDGHHSVGHPIGGGKRLKPKKGKRIKLSFSVETTEA